MLSLSFDEDLNIIKEEVAKKLGITIGELEEELDRIRREVPGLISERLSLLLLLERKGLVDQELIKKLSSESFFFPIIDLAPGMQGVTVIGRIIRFLRSRESNTLSFLIRDHTGEAIVIIRGRNTDLFRKMGFEAGDLLMIKNANVSKSATFVKRIIVDNESEIYYLEESDVIRYQIGVIPKETKIYEVGELLRLLDESPGELREIDVKGVVSWIGSLMEVKLSGNRKISKIAFRLRDDRNVAESIRVIAWGKIAEDISREVKVDQIILLQGCVLKENQYLTSKTGRKVIELHVGNLSNFKVVGVKRVKISELKPGVKVKLYAFILSNPVVKSFIDKNNNERNVLYCYVGDESGSIRLVVWKPDAIEVAKDLKPGSKVMIIGMVKESKFSEGKLEIHVSSDKDTIEVEPDNWPKELKLELVKRNGLEVKQEKNIETISDFSQIPLASTISIEGYLKSIRRSSRERGPIGIASILDENGNEVVLMIWNEQIVDELEKLSEGVLVKLINVRSPKVQKADTPVLFVGERSGLEIISHKENVEVTDVSTSINSISNASIGISVIFGTVTDVLFAGDKEICPICGLPITSKSEEGDVCPRGHIVKAIKKPTLIFTIDDDIKVAKVILTGDQARRIVRDLGFELSDLMSNQDSLDMFKLMFVGDELVIKGEISEEALDADYLIIAQEVFKADPNKLKKAIIREINPN